MVHEPAAARPSPGAVKTAGLPVAWRFPLLLLGMLSLLASVSAGLLRAGWNVPVAQPAWVGLHAPLMIGAFFGTVIGLERAVALGRSWGYLSPLAAGLSGILLGAGAPPLIALLLMACSAVVLTLTTLRAAQRQPSLHAHILAVAAALAVTAPLAWLVGQPMAAIAGWMGFLVLTIAGERLELSRFLPPSPLARRLFIGIVAAFLLAVLATWFDTAALRLLGVTLAALALWLLRQDVARRTVRQAGLPRFIALCLLSGYAWLLVGGGLLAWQPETAFLMDAGLHAIFVGFVLAMVFGHAPIIFPAVVRVALPYHRGFYLPLLVLHLSLLLRVGGGLAEVADWRALGAAGNALALALFILTMLFTVLSSSRLISSSVRKRRS
jgi:hypothetical protein